MHNQRNETCRNTQIEETHARHLRETLARPAGAFDVWNHAVLDLSSSGAPIVLPPGDARLLVLRVIERQAAAAHREEQPAIANRDAL